MKDKTTFRNIAGSWVMRIPPSFAQHIGLPENYEGVVLGEIQDEENKKGERYISAWRRGK